MVVCIQENGIVFVKWCSIGDFYIRSNRGDDNSICGIYVFESIGYCNYIGLWVCYYNLIGCIFGRLK